MAVFTGGQALARSLAREGIKVVFGVPGAGQYEAIDGLYEASQVQYITTRHEHATSYMADGYARVSGKPAAILVVPGPGMYNSMAGITGAYSQGSPMVVVSGEGHTDRSMDDDLAFVRGITKWTGKIGKAEDVPGMIHEAFRQIRKGRPGPIYIEIPQRVLAAEVDVELREPARPSAAVPSPKSLQDGTAAMIDAEKPAILVTGVLDSNTSDVLKQLAEHLQVPVLTSIESKGSLSDRHPLCLGIVNLHYKPLRTWMYNRDTYLIIGPTGPIEGFLRAKTIVNIDVEKSSDTAVKVGIVGNTSTCLKTLYRQIASTTQARESDVADLDTIRADRFGSNEQLEPQASFTRAIRSAVPDNGILIQGMTQLGYYSRHYYPVYEPRTYLTAAHSTLGHAFPVALGAKIAAPERAVVAVSGDGGFLYNSQELATAVQYGSNVIVIVFNDNAYGNVLRAQQRQFDGRVMGTRLHNPDFVALAQSYGAIGMHADGAEALERALQEAITNNETTVIEVPVGIMERRY